MFVFVCDFVCVSVAKIVQLILKCLMNFWKIVGKFSNLLAEEIVNTKIKTNG